MNAPRLVEVPVAGVLVADRVREPDPAVVAALQEDIAARGLRQPIEIAARKGDQPWRLVSGAHRLAAAAALGWETIPAFVVKGNLDELLGDELLENLQRGELSMMERARFAHELQELWKRLHPEARHGGDRRSEDFKDPDLASWSTAVAKRTGWSSRKAQRLAQIGRHLDREACAALRGTAAEHNQGELELLAREEPERQRDLAKILRSGGAGTVRSALVHLGQSAHEDLDEDELVVRRVMRLWMKASPAARRQIRSLVTGRSA